MQGHSHFESCSFLTNININGFLLYSILSPYVAHIRSKNIHFYRLYRQHVRLWPKTNTCLELFAFLIISCHCVSHALSLSRRTTTLVSLSSHGPTNIHETKNTCNCLTIHDQPRTTTSDNAHAHTYTMFMVTSDPYTQKTSYLHEFLRDYENDYIRVYLEHSSIHVQTFQIITNCSLWRSQYRWHRSSRMW